ncbi:hypothetical protein [Nannocystis pusilla]|uniref:hypothetical protein n=1 Tax=Nannocystis pusilla TaxID=889268 RepID=UPI003DA3F524
MRAGPWARLFEREPALFAAGLRAATIAAALWLSLEVDLRWTSLPKDATVSVAGLVVPTAWWSSPALLWLGRALLWGGAATWLLGHARTIRLIAAWATALGMLTLGSLYWENLPWFRHKFVPPLWLLVVLVAHEHARAEPGQAPRWVREGAVFVLACFYAGAGLNKVLTFRVALGRRDGAAAVAVAPRRLGQPGAGVGDRRCAGGRGAGDRGAGARAGDGPAGASAARQAVAGGRAGGAARRHRPGAAHRLPADDLAGPRRAAAVAGMVAAAKGATVSRHSRGGGRAARANVSRDMSSSRERGDWWTAI